MEKIIMGNLLPKAIGLSFNLLAYVSPAWVGRNAVHLFCRPRKGKLKPADEIFLATSEQSSNLSAPFGKFSAYTWNQAGQKRSC